MNKPMSMSVKEWLIKRMAINLVVSEKIIDTVITHQFDSAHTALVTNNVIEISGFGKFTFNVKKANMKYKKLLDIKKAYENILNSDSITDKKRHSTEKRMETIVADIKTLKTKVDEQS
jgi:nucleoid DNA-binding protein